ncbi:MAG TPA: aldehyde dehydrogenase family protein, partial [Acidimicrobiales bacterium]|nr:aldehyde dehydrogenase family protein [Acidimicrobiales bacterium]
MPIATVNPANGDTVKTFEALDDAGVSERLALAASAFQSWRKTSFAERRQLVNRLADIIEADADSLGRTITIEMGKPVGQAVAEVKKCATGFRYFAEHAEAMLREENLPTKGSRSGVRFDPIGPIFAVMPWNFPWWQVIRMAVPTLMAGNVVVFKHAPNVPGNAKYLEDLFHRAGI